MPTYDYLCAACSHTFEIFEGLSASAPKACPKCGKRKAKRRMGTGGGLIFKGSGFYVTDYKKSGSSGGEPKPKGEAPKGDAPKGDAPKAEGGKKEGKESKT